MCRDERRCIVDFLFLIVKRARDRPASIFHSYFFSMRFHGGPVFKVRVVMKRAQR